MGFLQKKALKAEMKRQKTALLSRYRDAYIKWSVMKDSKYSTPEQVAAQKMLVDSLSLEFKDRFGEDPD
ncbi:hypothetical protein [Nocardia abscessus]|uniref:hypothetical protein n=1 Tax=Nocardia abscessus TaxID=120957 RepID=UPI0024555C17|nr:hypothetical protein [Nocardia abscessus]